jgi:hypothetical protein
LVFIGFEKNVANNTILANVFASKNTRVIPL